MIVYSYYVLDIVHRGHLEQMMNAKAAAGDGISVVGILTDEAAMEKKREPVLSFDERVALAHAIRYNDFVVAQKTYSPLPNIESIRPDIVIESDSHDPLDIVAVREYLGDKGRVIVTPYYPGQSSSGIKQVIKDGQAL